MSSSPLRARAAAAQDDQGWGDVATVTPGSGAPATERPPAPPEPERLPNVEVPEGLDDDPAEVPVQVAVARAMRDLGKVTKAERFDGGNAGRYNFRGVDRVVNACAPVLRKHGLIVMPEVRSVEYRDVARAGGGRSHECSVTVAWHWIGPRGDELVAITQGESLDTSDKATAKAQSVAWRVCLIQTLAIPTGDPDPDSVLIERGEQPLPKPIDYRDEIVHPDTSLGRLKQIRGELQQHRLAGVIATNEHGDEEALLDMVNRIGKARQEGGPR